MSDEIDKGLSDAFLADLHGGADINVLRTIADAEGELSKYLRMAASDALKRFEAGEQMPENYRVRQEFRKRPH